MSYGSSDHDPAVFGSVADEADPWRNPPPFAGDFYREPDTVVRGVSMAQHDLPGSSYKGFVEGDFYREPDELYKGMSMMSADVGSDLFPGSLDFPDCLGSKMPDCLSKFEDGYSMSTEQVGCIFPGPETFKETDTPPTAPTDPFFKFEITTMYVSSTTPYEIGNQLLDFLATKVVSSVTKVNRKKFAIKADVFVELIMCTIKIRIYQEERGTYAIEFQRRDGDTVAFNNFYQQATKYILPRFTAMTSFPEVGDLFLPPPPKDKASATDDEDGVLPLLDMASQVELPGLQAECASTLADIAQDNKQAKTLCTSTAFEEFKKLLQNDQTDVAYPTARMLQSLAQCPEAVPCFADQKLLSMILDKVQSKETSALVQQKLAQVLNTAISRCAASLSEKVSEEVMKALSEAIKEVDRGNTPTQRNLQEAKIALQYKSPATSWG